MPGTRTTGGRVLGSAGLTWMQSLRGPQAISSDLAALHSRRTLALPGRLCRRRLGNILPAFFSDEVITILAFFSNEVIIILNSKKIFKNSFTHTQQHTCDHSHCNVELNLGFFSRPVFGVPVFRRPVNFQFLISVIHSFGGRPNEQGVN